MLCTGVWAGRGGTAVKLNRLLGAPCKRCDKQKTRTATSATPPSSAAWRSPCEALPVVTARIHSDGSSVSFERSMLRASLTSKSFRRHPHWLVSTMTPENTTFRGTATSSNEPPPRTPPILKAEPSPAPAGTWTQVSASRTWGREPWL